MNRKSGSGSEMFLMEMMVVVGFFILCASTCILAFARADHMSRLADDRNQAVSVAQSVAEVWKLEGMEGLKNRLGPGWEYREAGYAEQTGEPSVMPDGPSCKMYWDQNWQAVDGPEAEDCAYEGTLSVAEDGQGMEQARIFLYRNGGYGGSSPTTLFELEVWRYRQPQKGGPTDGKV